MVVDMETFTFLDDNKIKKRITITPYKDNQWKCDCEGITDWHEFVWQHARKLRQWSPLQP